MLTIQCLKVVPYRQPSKIWAFASIKLIVNTARTFQSGFCIWTCSPEGEWNVQLPKNSIFGFLAIKWLIICLYLLNFTHRCHMTQLMVLGHNLHNILLLGLDIGKKLTFCYKISLKQLQDSVEDKSGWKSEPKPLSRYHLKNGCIFR